MFKALTFKLDQTIAQVFLPNWLKICTETIHLTAKLVKVSHSFEIKSILNVSM